ncbi:hypothetical protein STEG23_001266, partial [Scotinomys teguina]
MLRLVFAMLGPVFAMLRPVFAMLRPVFAMLGPVFAMLGPVFAMLGPVFAMLGPVFAMLRPVFAMLGPVFAMLRPVFAMLRPARVLQPGQGKLMKLENIILSGVTQTQKDKHGAFTIKAAQKQNRNTLVCALSLNIFCILVTLLAASLTIVELAYFHSVSYRNYGQAKLGREVSHILLLSYPLEFGAALSYSICSCSQM